MIHESRRIWWVAPVLVAAFAMDNLAHFNYAGELLYVLGVLVAAMFGSSRHVVLTAAVCSALVLVGLAPRLPASGPALWEALAHRALALLTIWVAARLGGRESQRRRLQRTLEATPQGIVLLDRDRSIVMVNDRIEKLFDRSRDTLVGEPVEKLIPKLSSGDHQHLFADLIRNPIPRKVRDGNLTGLRKDAREVPIEVDLAGVEIEGHPHVVASIVDVTARKRMEAALLQAKDTAEASNRAKSDFLANMSHEIRTPLNTVIGLTEATLRTELSETQRDHLHTVLDSGESLLSVLDFLDFAKIEAGEVELEQIQFDLRDTIEDTLRSLAIRAHDKGLELTCSIDPQLPSVMIGDPARLRQVLSNLVANAIKFTERGEVVVRVELEAADGYGFMLVHFSVRDTGVGIQPELLDRMFEPFEQAALSSLRRTSGSGLGLSICQELVELMGGQIGVESTPGEGSTFHFTVKFEVPLQFRERSPREFPALAGMRVLIVGDHPAHRSHLDELTRAAQMRPVLATSADEASTRLREALESGDPVRAVLCDVELPDGTGIGLAEEIRRDPRFGGPAIVFVTSAGQALDPERCRELRIAGRLARPVNPSELFPLLDRALGSAYLEETSPSRDGVSRSPRDAGLAAGQHQEIQIPPQRILLVEDSLANQKVAQAILESHEHVIVVAQNGREAVDRLAEETFDLVLMDVQMPEMDGLEATVAIRAAEATRGGHVPIIAMTAHALRGDRERCLAAGMDDYVPKPIRRRELFQALARAVHRG